MSLAGNYSTFDNIGVTHVAYVGLTTSTNNSILRNLRSNHSSGAIVMGGSYNTVSNLSMTENSNWGLASSLSMTLNNSTIDRVVYSNLTQYGGPDMLGTSNHFSNLIMSNIKGSDYGLRV